MEEWIIEAESNSTELVSVAANANGSHTLSFSKRAKIQLAVTVTYSSRWWDLNLGPRG